MLGPLAGRLARRKALSCHLRHSSAPRALSTAPPPVRQRRKSSSKPAAPPDDGEQGPVSPPAEATAGPAAPAAKDIAPAPRRRAGSKSRAKDGARGAPAAANTTAPYSIPSVPSTQHLSFPDVIISSFFALHRPISVDASTLTPAPTTMEQFMSQFTSGSGAKPQPDHVVYTLASVARSLDQAITQAEQQQQQQPGPLQQPYEPPASSRRRTKAPAPQPQPPRYIQVSGSAANAAHLKTIVSAALQQAAEPAPAPGAAPGPPAISLDELVRVCRPFNPPPPPMPMPDFQLQPRAEDAPSVADELLPASTDSVHTEESAGGRARQPFLARMWRRQAAWEQSRRMREPPRARGPAWRAISVRRQRKLKMKKHKYKKLQKKLRNMKRKLDRL